MKTPSQDKPPIIFSTPLVFSRWKCTTALLLLIGSVFPDQAMSQTVWDGGATGTGQSWATGTNWAGDAQPANNATSNVVIDNRNGTGTIVSPMSISATRTLGLITFDNVNSRLPSTLNIDTNLSGTTARSLTLHTGITLQNTTTTVTFRGNAGTLSVVLGANNTFTTSAGSTLNFGPSVGISGGFSLTKQGDGTLRLEGTNSYSGGTNVNAGTLTYLNTNARPGSGTTTVAAGATLGLGVATSGAFFTSTDVDGLFAGTLANVTNDAASRVGIDTTAGDFTYASSIASTTRGLTKLGANALTLSGTNAYTGLTTLTGGGMLRLDSAGALPGGIGATGGTSNLVLGGGVIGLTAASGDFLRGIGTGPGEVTWTANTTNGFAAFGGDRTVNFGGAAAPVTWQNVSGVLGLAMILGDSTSDSTVTITNPIALSNSPNTRTVTVQNGSAAVDAIFAGAITSTGTGLIKAGEGTLALTATNTYGSTRAAGNTRIDAGTLQIGNGGTTGTLPTSTDVIINSATATLAFNRSDVAPIVANNITGTGAVRQIGAGTTTLSGANTYSGGTTVTAGTLMVNNTTGSGTGSGALNTSGSTILGGTGTISPTGSNAVTIGGAVQPGVSGSPGTLTFTPVDGNVTMQSSSTVAFQLFGNGSNDKIVFNASGSGLFDFSAMAAGSLGVTFSGYTPALNDSFDLLDWAALTGSGMNGLSASQLDLPSLPDLSWIWDTSSFTTNGSIFVSIVPEPSRALLMGIGLVALAGRRRR